MRILIVVEKAKSGYSAYSPDFPGCVATGTTRENAITRMIAAIRFHVEGMRAEGQKIPTPKSYSTYVDVPA
jgi:predicted RNase H-like HicB family nuclease